jgi:hypothetical protein
LAPPPKERTSERLGSTFLAGGLLMATEMAFPSISIPEKVLSYYIS